MRWRVNWFRHELVPGIRKDAAFGRHRAEQRVQHEQSACYGPSVADSRSHTAPVMTGEASAGSRHDLRDFLDRFGVDSRFCCGEFEGVFVIEFFQDALKFFERQVLSV